MSDQPIDAQGALERYRQDWNQWPCKGCGSEIDLREATWAAQVQFLPGREQLLGAGPFHDRCWARQPKKSEEFGWEWRLLDPPAFISHR